MLTHLSISNYAIIEKLETDFTNGFTVITGETGAGKSILLGALSLILGERVDTSVLNDKSKKCIVEGVFNITNQHVASIFIAHDLEVESETYIRREIATSGKSRAFINDSPVTLPILKKITGLLMDVHTQHETLHLKDSTFQLRVIDSFIGLSDQVSTYTQQYHDYLALKQKFTRLANKEAESKSDLDYIEFQINELAALQLTANEQAQLEEQLEVMNNAEEIQQVLSQASYSLLNSDHTLLSELKSLINSFQKISHCSEKYLQFKERLEASYIELSDLAREIDVENESEHVNVNEVEYIQERLNKIYTLEQKHRVSNSDALLDTLKELQNKLTNIHLSEEELQDLNKMILNTEKELLLVAKAISKQRTGAFKKLAATITQHLKELGMPDASFQIKQTTLSTIDEMGIDSVVFMFSANKGFNPSELSKVASGGELSRLMLTMKSILSQSKNISTLLFDEIDTGVSGDVADKMGEMIKQMSKSIQVISITHLPQVAAKGDEHFKIFKSTSQNKTTASLKKLSQNDRIEELAKMLSGKELSNAALENAKSLITN